MKGPDTDGKDDADWSTTDWDAVCVANQSNLSRSTGAEETGGTRRRLARVFSWSNGGGLSRSARIVSQALAPLESLSVSKGEGWGPGKWDAALFDHRPGCSTGTGSRLRTSFG